MLNEITYLREIARRCLAGEPLDDSLSRWLGRSLDGFLSQRYRTVDEALGLRGERGGMPWWREEANRVRDAALRELAARLSPDLSVSGQARLVHDLSCRYASSAWCRDRARETMPMHYAGTPKELLWRAFKSGATMPVCERHLRNILAQ